MRKKAFLLAAVCMALVLGNTGAAGAGEQKIRAEVDGRRIFWDYGDEAVRLTTKETLVLDGFQDLKKNGELDAVCVYHFETGETVEIGNSWETVRYTPSEDGSYIPFLIFKNGMVRMIFEYGTVNGENVSDVGSVRMI